MNEMYQKLIRAGGGLDRIPPSCQQLAQRLALKAVLTGEQPDYQAFAAKCSMIRGFHDIDTGGPMQIHEKKQRQLSS